MRSISLPKPGFAALSCVSLLLPAAVLMAHAGLWSQGGWKSDEYYGFASWRLWGFAGEWFRLIHWGPRPFSEALLYVYWCAVRATGRPLVACAVGSAWAILFVFLLAALRPWQSPGRAARWAMLLTLPALFLLSAPIEDLYYHPYSALAYLPALGAACFATIGLAGPGLGDRRGWVPLATALGIGATSVEHGTFLAAGLAPFLLIIAAKNPRSSRVLRLASVISVMIIVAAIVILFWTGRISTAHEIFGNPAIAHRVGIDARLTILTLAREISHPEGWTPASSILVKFMVFAGVRQCLAAVWPAQPSRLALIGVLVGLAVTSFLSVFGAYYNFGVLCCERMAAYRQALFLLMLVAGAGLSRPSRARPIGWVLALATLIHIHPRFVAIEAEYRLADLRAAARRMIFSSGMTPGPAALDYVTPPSGPLFSDRGFPPGVYTYLPQAPGPSQFPMLYFGKQRMWAHKVMPGADGKQTRDNLPAANGVGH